MHHSVDGFRTDAIYHLIKDDQFRDDPPNPDYVEGRDDPYNKYLHTYSQGRPELLKETNAMCEVLGFHAEHSEDAPFMISEAYLGIPEMQKMYGACANNRHAPFNFNLMGMSWDAMRFKEFVDNFEMSLTPLDWPNYVLGNHDRPRIASHFGQQRARILAMMQLTLRGMPFIYNGEELGMENVTIPKNKIYDPWGRKGPYGFNFSRDPERTPMQWNGEKNAGFSDVEPWLPVHENHTRVNAELESKDEGSMLSLYRHLIHYREKSPALLTGSYRSLDVKNDHIFAYVRECEAEQLLVLLNFSDKDEVAAIDFGEGKAICNTYGDVESGAKKSVKNITLRPYEGHVFNF